MHTIIEILLPVFGFIICGYCARRVCLINDAGVDGIMTFVVYFAVPALLFRVVAGNEIPSIDDLSIVLAYYSGCFLVFIASAIYCRIMFSLSLDKLGVLGMGSIYSNTVLLGMPLVFTIFGEAGMLPILMIITFHNILLFPIVIGFIEIGRGRQAAAVGGWVAVLIHALRETLENPIIIALIFSFIWAAVGLGVPAPLEAFTELLSKSVTPAALFGLGASMAGYRITGVLSESVTIAVLKLTVHPLMVWLLGRYVFELNPLYLAVATITAGVPVGANVFIIAHKYKIYQARITSAMAISGIFSILTLTMMVSYFSNDTQW